MHGEVLWQGASQVPGDRFNGAEGVGWDLEKGLARLGEMVSVDGSLFVICSLRNSL